LENDPAVWMDYGSQPGNMGRRCYPGRVPGVPPVGGQVPPVGGQVPTVGGQVQPKL
jgi:hypothetical protein